MEVTGKQESQCWIMQDVACTNCRSRKIRCDRERPRCGSCARDHVQCTYSSPTKRVNHVKVLAQGFDDIQNRLIDVQQELRSLTKMFQGSGIADGFPFNLGLHQNGLQMEGTIGEDELLAPTDGHVVRDDNTLVEKYYGPWTLPALCRSFAKDLATDFGADACHDRMPEEMWRRALGDGQCWVGTEHETGRDAVGLPPRQFLTVVLHSFFGRDDHATDIFVPSAFYNAIERTYTEPSNPASEAWAVCFNLVILLVIGAEQGSGRQDLFIQPLVRAAQVAARNPAIFLSPRLVNVQVLALLSLLNQQSYSETLGDELFAQACMLAKGMGLDRAVSTPPSQPLSPEEVEGRRRVFRSLYIRDQCSSIARGTPTWLTNCHSTPLSAHEPSGTTNLEIAPSVEMQDACQSERNDTAWCELTSLQNMLLHVLSARENHGPGCVHARRMSLSRLMQRLELWSQKHGVPASAIPTTPDEVSLHLAFLGTRMRVLVTQRNVEAEAVTAARALHDARLSCLLFLVACDGRRDNDLVAWLERLLGVQPPGSGAGTASTTTGFNTPATQHSVSPPAPDAAGPLAPEATRTRSHTVSSAASKVIPAPSPKPIGVRRLALVFPAMALFILARNILGMGVLGSVRSGSRTEPRGTKDEQRKGRDSREVEGDTALLKAILAIFLSATAAADSGLDNRTVKLGRVVQVLVDILAALDHRAHSENAPGSPCEDSVIDPLLEGAWTKLPDGGNTAAGDINAAIGIPDLNHLSAGSSWTNDQGSSAEYLSRTGSSMTSISATAMSDVALDISQLMDRMGTDTTGAIWGELDAGMATTAAATVYQQDVTQSPRTRRKRARTNFALGEGEESEYL
ncbi:hypothetical protein VTI28DRAFT_1811 [Corynascus sepedonium]